MAESAAAAVAETPTLDFERPVVALERKIEELVRVSGGAPSCARRSRCWRRARASCSRRSSRS
jgi:hypothetical protein